MRTRPHFLLDDSDVCWARARSIRNKQDHELAIERLEARPSEMRSLQFSSSGLSDEWAVEFARRALPNLPKLEGLL